MRASITWVMDTFFWQERDMDRSKVEPAPNARDVLPMDGHSAPPWLEFTTRDAWRSWLEANHPRGTKAWVLIRKKHSQGRGIFLDDAVEEAICYGYIDGIMRAVDGNSYVLRFTPRRPGSTWSKINTERAETLINQGKVAPSGMREIEAAMVDGRWKAAYSSKARVEVPRALEAALDRDGIAKDNFNSFPNSARFQYIHWINQAKTEGARERRIHETVRRSRQGMKPGDR